MHIVIVGGGTAGWLAALMISKTQPNHKITVIESSKLGIIGAGEGSTGSLTNIIQGQEWDYGISEAEFLRKTQATIKLGVRHRDWKTLGHEYIAPIDPPYDAYVNNFGTSTSLCDLLSKDKPFHLASKNGYYIEHGLSSFNYHEGNVTNEGTHSYHFDGHLVGSYFKEKCIEQVNHIDSKITSVDVLPSGEINGVFLEDGSLVKGDFFIDASGFSRVIAKAMKLDWVSYKKHLTVNTAMPFFVNYKETEQVLPVTTAWAQKSGWMWQIPTQARYGCGYVFDSNYTSREEAQLEIETVLGHEISPIKFIDFEAGRLEKSWNKNCLFIGLASAFLEPLEATSIHSTIVQLHSFIFSHLRDTKEETCNSGGVNIYNTNSSKMYDGFRDFLSIHYATQRTDTEFWRMASNTNMRTENALNILEVAKTRLLNDGDFYKHSGFEGSVLHNWVLAGLGHLTPETARKELSFYGQTAYGEQFQNHSLQALEINRVNQIPNNDLIRMFTEVTQ